MLEIKDIDKLAKLARIDLTDEQKKSYLKELGAILSYVDQIRDIVAKTGEERKLSNLRNVVREDSQANPTGENTDVLVSEFPRQERNYLQVKKIIEQ